MSDALTKLKAEGIAVIAQQVFGTKPNVSDTGKYIRIYWNDEDLPETRKRFERYVSEIEPGDIRVEWLPVVQNTAFKKALPYALAIFAAGFIVGKL